MDKIFSDSSVLAQTPAPKYEQIYAVVAQIPPGKVATYGQIASLVGGCTARMTGYALAALASGKGKDIPWQRVINRQGKISPHGHGLGNLLQRQMLVDEGVQFGADDRVDFKEFGWFGEP